jgi:hypothetical protein
MVWADPFGLILGFKDYPFGQLCKTLGFNGFLFFEKKKNANLAKI